MCFALKCSYHMSRYNDAKYDGMDAMIRLAKECVEFKILSAITDVIVTEYMTIFNV